MIKQYLISPLEVVQSNRGNKMRYSLAIVAILLLSNCAKPQAGCDQGGTATNNGQTYSLVNGACSATYAQSTLNSLSVKTVTVCGQNVGVIYNGVIYNVSPANINPTSPVGYTAYPDNYYVLNQPNNVQCWFNVSSGVINPGAVAPTF